jgi:hypothetical protein
LLAPVPPMTHLLFAELSGHYLSVRSRVSSVCATPEQERTSNIPTAGETEGSRARQKWLSG